MNVDEPTNAEDQFLSSMVNFHESLVADSTQKTPAELSGNRDPEILNPENLSPTLSARLRRAHRPCVY